MTPPAQDSVALDVLELVSRQYGCNAVLEGSGSFVSEGEIADELPSYDGDTALHTHFLPEYITRQPSPPHHWLVVVDSRGRVRWTEKHADWDVLVLVARSTPADYLAYLRRERVCCLCSRMQAVPSGSITPYPRDGPAGNSDTPGAAWNPAPGGSESQRCKFPEVA